MNDQETKEAYERLREIAKNYKTPIIITAHQHPYLPGYNPPPPLDHGVIFIDYLSLIK